MIIADFFLKPLPSVNNSILTWYRNKTCRGEVHTPEPWRSEYCPKVTPSENHHIFRRRKI